MARSSTLVAAAALAAGIASAAALRVAAADPPARATLSGPVHGGARGRPFGALEPADPAASRLSEAEYFFSGSATAYDKDGAWGLDGVWNIKPSRTAPYKVRMLVRRPADPARFNGVLVVEWLNVTALQEGAADYGQMKEEIERGGYAWAGIGAQATGVDAPRTGLKAWDADRYGSLQHPGDAFSYDIFTQGARALLDRSAGSPLAGLRVRAILATGRSQSAFRLVTYLNALHPRTHLFQGYLVHSRGASAAGISAEQLARDPDPVPTGAHIRGDLDVPVLDLQTEGDMAALRAHLTHQPPSARYRRWEIAGAAHAESPRWVAVAPPPLEMGAGCKAPINTAPHDAVVKAALQALTRWVRNGTAPPQSPAIQITDPAAADPIARDRFGNATGGIRLPELEAPTATLDGTRNDVANPSPEAQNFCFLFGHTVPFEAATLKSLYPTHAVFVERFGKAVDALVRDGYFLRPEADAAKAAAQRAAVP
jgi:alpha/beta hydrolase family protein